MRRWIAQTGSSYVAPGGFIDGANRSRRQIAMTAPVTQQEVGWEHPGSLAAAGTRSGPAAGPWPALLSCPSTARARTGWRRP